MEIKPMKILIIEDDIDDCNKLINCAKNRDDIESVAVTDSDVEGLRYVKALKPEGIILDIELNNAYIGSGLSVYTISISIINKKEYKNYQEIIKALSCLDYIHYIEELK